MIVFLGVSSSIRSRLYLFFFFFNFLAGWVGLSRGGRMKQGRETPFKLIQFKTSIMVLSHIIADPIIEWFYLSPGH